MKRIIAVVFMAIVLSGCSVDAQQVNVKYTWTPPTSGSEAVLYEVLISSSGSAYTVLDTVATNEITFDVAYPFTDMAIKVKGIDAIGNAGPYSAASEAFTYLGPPGEPGRPEWVAVIAGIAGFIVMILGLSLIFGKKDNEVISDE